MEITTNNLELSKSLGDFKDDFRRPHGADTLFALFADNNYDNCVYDLGISGFNLVYT